MKIVLEKYILYCLIIAIIFNIEVMAQSIPEILKDVKKDIVSVYSYDSLGNYIGQGTGFFISDKKIITCYHVIEDADNIYIETYDKKEYQFDSLGSFDFEGDLVQIYVTTTETHFGLPLASKYPEQGEKVIVVGNPLGFKGSISDGLVAAVREIDDFGKIIQITAPISSGSSGSPVINIEGEVIGIVSFMMVDGQNVNFAIPFERINLIDSNYDKYIDKLIDLISENYTDEYLLQSIDSLIDLGKFLDALNEIELLSDDYNEDLTIIFKQGYCYLNLDQHLRAISLFKRILGQVNIESAHYNISVSYLALGDTNSAIHALDQALIISPFDSTYLRKNAILNYYYSEADKALDILNTFRKKYPQDSYVQSLVCDCYYVENKYDSAITCYKKYFSQQRDDVYSRGRFGYTLIELELYDEALKQFKFLYKKTKSEADYAYYLADCFRSLNRCDSAIHYYESALIYNPSIPDLHNDYGVCLDDLGYRLKAIEEYKKAIELDPVDWTYHWNLGNSYMVLGKLKKADESFKKVKLLKEEN